MKLKMLEMKGETLDEFYIKFENKLRELGTVECKTVVKRRVRWWNAELGTLRKVRDEKYRQYVSKRRDEDWVEYKRARNKFVREARRFKKEFVCKILRENRRDGKKTWKILNDLIGGKKTEGMRNEVIRVGDKKFVGIEGANEINKYLVESVMELNETIKCNKEWVMYGVERGRETYKELAEFREVTVNMVEEVIGKLKNSVGDFPVCSTIIKRYREKMGGIITEIVNQALRGGNIPEVLKKAVVTPIST